MDELHATVLATPLVTNDIETDDNEIDDPNNYGK